jgi:omega-amidase
MKKWKVAVVQMRVEDNIQDNLQEILKYIKKAAKKKANIVCFPEVCLICDRNLIKNITKETKVIQEVAKTNSIHTIFGTYIKDSKGAIRNQIMVVNNSGEIIHRYNKRYPYISEQGFLKTGKKNKVLELDKIPFAVINCWDYSFPEHIRELARKGAKIIFCPSYLMSFPQTSQVLNKIPQIRAFDCMGYFIMVDAYADDSYQESKICHPLKEIKSISKKEGMIIADLDIHEIEVLREEYQNLQPPKLIME